MQVNTKTWRLFLFVYLLLLFIFIVVKFNGNINDLMDRRAGILANREMGYWNYNLTPQRSTARYYVNIFDDYAYKNILGNIVPFVPLGFLLPLSKKRKVAFFKILGYCFLIVLSIEVFQLITMLGFFDIDDIWLNMSGCMIGYLIFVICNKTKLLISEGK